MSLSDDMLWSIFMLNAIDSSERKEKNLTTTRFSSQVCRLWRNLILGSPTIWGRLVLINHRQKEEWLKEVLKRSGGSSLIWLQIEWSPPSNTNDLSSSFVDICTRSWDRVEDLHVEIGYEWRENRRLTRQFWKLISRPAPCLRSASFFTSGSTFPEDLFGNSAPLLISILCQESLTYKYTFLSQIETLYFQPESIDNLYDVLRWTPRLRVLKINHLALDSLSDAQCSQLASMSPYILPRLAKIDSILSFKEFNALWSTRSRSPAETNTSHCIHCRNTTVDMNVAQFREAVGNLINHHGGNSSDTHDIKVVVNIMDWNLAISLKSNSLQMQLFFTIRDTPFATLEAALDAFMAHMGNCVYFEIQLPGGDKAFGRLEKSCSSMTKVHTIHMNSEALTWYNEIERSGCLLFPSLMTIEWICNMISDEDIRNMSEFIQRRSEAGLFLLTLHVVKPNDMKAICDGLNKHHGLRITWYFYTNEGEAQEREYVCGQSEPLSEW